MKNKVSSMKLRSKMMSGLFLILAAAMVICCVFLLTTCKKTIIRETQIYMRQENRDLCDELNHQMAGLFESSDELTKLAGMKYYFSDLARSATEDSEYVLQQDGENIYNNSGIDVAAVLGDIPETSVNGQVEIVCKPIHSQGQDYYVSGISMSLWSEKYLVGIVRNITDSMKMVRTLAVRCIFICGCITTAAALFTFLFLKRSLAPIELLDKNAKKIASGEYNCRIEIKRQDELGTLGESFNTMVQAVEQHILQVETAANDQNMLLHALAHEMRTPVTAISGYAYALQYAKLSQEQKEEAIAFMESESLRLERLTKKITELVHMDSDQIERRRISAAELFAQLEQLENSVYVSVAPVICYDYAEGDSIFGDFDLLVMLLTNLTDNARKAGADRITVSYRDGVLSVSDNGQGILPEQLEKIMQPFYQGDFSRNRQGFGLGLALCEKIAALHGGKLQVSSTAGQGTRFSVNLNNSFTCC